MAPELFKHSEEESEDPGKTCSSDVYALGMTIFEVCGSVPLISLV